MSATTVADPFNPTPTPPPPERETLPARVLVALAVLAAAIVVGGGLFTWRTAVEDASPAITIVDRSVDEEGAPTTEPPDEDASAVDDEQATSGDEATDVEPAACPEGTDELFCELVAFVETERGRAFKEFPTIDLAPTDEFRARLLDGFEDDTADLQNYGDILRSLGLIPATTDIVAVYRDLLEIGVVGFYKTETGELVVRGGEFDLYVQSVLVHELAHAHDDQWLDLDRPEFDDATDESGAGFLAIQEGNAERVSEAWLATLSADEQAEVDRQSLSLLTQEDFAVLARIPPFMAQDLSWPYTAGLTLVEAIAAAGGEEAVDAAYADPPETTEEVLHPELYLSGDDYQELPLPEHPGESVVDGMIGEIWFQFWLGETASVGWGADRFVTFRDAGRLCTIVVVEADTEQDLAEMRSALGAWESSGSGRSVTDQGDGLRIEGCLSE